MLHFIYRWKDPRNQTEPLCTKYVGMTNNPNARINSHMGRYGSNKEKHDWIRELVELELEPIFEIIEIIYDGKEAAFDREKYWVKYYLDQGCQLINIRLVPNQPRTKITPIKYPFYCSSFQQSERTAKYFDGRAPKDVSEEEKLEDFFIGSLEELEMERGKELTLDDEVALILCLFEKDESEFERYKAMKAQK